MLGLDNMPILNDSPTLLSFSLLGWELRIGYLVVQPLVPAVREIDKEPPEGK